MVDVGGGEPGFYLFFEVVEDGFREMFEADFEIHFSGSSEFRFDAEL